MPGILHQEAPQSVASRKNGQRVSANGGDNQTNRPSQNDRKDTQIKAKFAWKHEFDMAPEATPIQAKGS